MGWMYTDLRFSMTVAALAAAVVAAPAVGAQSVKTPAEMRHCECGKNPPPPPRDRVVAPYAGEPTDMSPYAKFTAPYDLNYVHPNIYKGAAREYPEPKGLKEIRIGFFGPVAPNPEAVFGTRMLHGVELAVEEANANGGYGGIPYKLMLHNDYDNWQAKAVYGEDRPTDPAIWGSASNETVKMVYDDEDWAIFGSISSESTHIAIRVALRAEIPIVNSASTDPTIPETYIPWYFTDLQDDRVQSLTLARRIYTELGMKRVALLRINSRYGRFGVLKFRDVSRRMGHPVVIEQKYLPGDKDFSRALRVIQSSRADAVVLWGDEEQAAMILKAMRAAGMKQRVFGSYRTIGDNLLKSAGDAAEGFEAVFPYDASRTAPEWLAFQQRYEARYHEKPEQFAALAYDAANQLLDSICKAGLNRARIHDALANIDHYDGVTGPMVYDPNQKNVQVMYLASVHNGSISYRKLPMEKEPAPVAPAASSVTPAAATTPQPTASAPKPASVPNNNISSTDPQPYARIGEEPITYLGPRNTSDASLTPRILLYGADANRLSHSPDLLSALTADVANPHSFTLVPIEVNGKWANGSWISWTASDKLADEIAKPGTIAILALDRDSSHLAEQLSLKYFLPVVALSDDRSLTAVNIPWIFRLPAATAPARALALLRQATASDNNPAILRDRLASGVPINGISFAQTGEPHFTN